MAHLIDKDALVAEIDRQKIGYNTDGKHSIEYDITKKIIDIINTLEVKDPYEEHIQYPSVKDGIKAHAEVYSFNIESELFPQLTKEQQALWRKEIEQACISGGDAGVTLARDQRYKENLEVKEADFEKEYKEYVDEDPVYSKLVNNIVGKAIAKHFFELGLKAQKGE